MLLVESIELDDDVMQFAFEVAGERISCLTHFHKSGNELHLSGLHLGGSAPNKVGRTALWTVAHELGRYFGVQILRIAGGRRTTGRFKGQIPTPFVISIPPP